MTSQRLIRNQDLAVERAERWSWALCQWTMVPKWLMANYVYKLKQLAETLSGRYRQEKEHLRIVSCVRENAFFPQGFQRSWPIHKWHRINSWLLEYLFSSLPTRFPSSGATDIGASDLLLTQVGNIKFWLIFVYLWVFRMYVSII